MGRGSWRLARRLLCCQSRCGKFFPEGQICWRLAGRIRFLKRLELPLQLPQRKRKAKLRCNEEGLNKKNRAQKDQNSGNNQDKPEARPSFPSRVGKNERSNRRRGIFFHSGNYIMSRDKRLTWRSIWQ